MDTHYGDFDSDEEELNSIYQENDLDLKEQDETNVNDFRSTLDLNDDNFSDEDMSSTTLIKNTDSLTVTWEGKLSGKEPTYGQQIEVLCHDDLEKSQEFSLIYHRDSNLPRLIISHMHHAYPKSGSLFFRLPPWQGTFYVISSKANHDKIDKSEKITISSGPKIDFRILKNLTSSKLSTVSEIELGGENIALYLSIDGAPLDDYNGLEIELLPKSYFKDSEPTSLIGTVLTSKDLQKYYVSGRFSPNKYKHTTLFCLAPDWTATPGKYYMLLFWKLNRSSCTHGSNNSMCFYVLDVSPELTITWKN